MNSTSSKSSHGITSILSCNFSDIEQFLEYVKVLMDVDSTQIDTGRIRISSQVIMLGDIMLARYFTSKAVFERYCVPAGHTLFAFGPPAGKEECVWCGCRVPGDFFGIIRPGREYSCHNPSGFDVVEVMVSDDWPVEEEMVDDQVWRNTTQPEQALFPMPGLRAGRFRDLLHKLFASPAMLELLQKDADLGDLFRQWILEELAWIVSSSMPPLPDGRHSGRSSRYELALAAIRIIDQQLREPLSITSLAKQLATSPRMLQYAFKENCNTSPLRYILHRKLQAARTELILTKSDKSSQVAKTAFLYGLNHLGRFSSNYKALFGESPSSTLKLNRPGKPTAPNLN